MASRALVLAACLTGAASAQLFPSVESRLFSPPAVAAPVKFAVSDTLGDHMVLQRSPQASTVWGFAAPGTVVKTTFSGTTYSSTAGADTVWRQALPPTAATSVGQTISFSASTGETAALNDVLFGDVYLCSGQSNMQFAIPAITNSSYETQRANDYPLIRLFSVGQGTSSKTPLMNLATIQETWSVASNTSVNNGNGFGIFSAVCWIFGRDVFDGLGGSVPVGLVSSNWGGTPVEHWADPAAFKRCGRPDTDSTLYNAMIAPFAVGPMSLSGFTWYQGEANTATQASADAYACLFPSMITSWRANFNVPAPAFFGFIQLSTWCSGDAIPIMREAQMAALTLGGVGYGVNADHGAGCNIHPPPKQFCATRMAQSALAIAYGKSALWKSPAYASATADASSATITLTDVTSGGLVLLPSANVGTVDCTKSAGQCGWASLQFNDAAATWVNATVSLTADAKGIVLTAPPPAGSSAVVATSYAWAAIPFMTVYSADADLPVLAWKRNITASV